MQLNQQLNPRRLYFCHSNAYNTHPPNSRNTKMDSYSNYFSLPNQSTQITEAEKLENTPIIFEYQINFLT
jgi:hypothetical protein